MSVLIRNDKFDFIINQAYQQYSISTNSFENVLDYGLKLATISLINKLFSITFYDASDILLIDDTSQISSEMYQYILNRIIIDAGVNIDASSAYNKYCLIKSNFDIILSDIRRIVTSNIIHNKCNNYRLQRGDVNFFINL
jgi:hypothetical protein